jgi:predicted transcriptional regulator
MHFIYHFDIIIVIFMMTTTRPNLLASNIENLILLLTSMEHRIQKSSSQIIRNENEEKEDNDNSSISTTSTSESKEVLDMKRRIQLAKLVRFFFRIVYFFICTL